MTKARNYERFNPVNIAGSIQTVFILWGGLIVVGLCVHIYVDLWEKIMRFVKLIRAMVVFCGVYLLKSIIKRRCLFK